MILLLAASQDSSWLNVRSTIRQQDFGHTDMQSDSCISLLDEHHFMPYMIVCTLIKVPCSSLFSFSIIIVLFVLLMTSVYTIYLFDDRPVPFRWLELNQLRRLGRRRENGQKIWRSEESSWPLQKAAGQTWEAHGHQQIARLHRNIEILETRKQLQQKPEAEIHTKSWIRAGPVVARHSCDLLHRFHGSRTGTLRRGRSGDRVLARAESSGIERQERVTLAAGVNYLDSFSILEQLQIYILYMHCVLLGSVIYSHNTRRFVNAPPAKQYRSSFAAAQNK